MKLDAWVWLVLVVVQLTAAGVALVSARRSRRVAGRRVRGLWWTVRREVRLRVRLVSVRVRFVLRRLWLAVRYSARVERWVCSVRYGTPHAPRWLSALWSWAGGVWWLMGPELADTVREVAGMVRARRFVLAI